MEIVVLYCRCCWPPSRYFHIRNHGGTQDPAFYGALVKPSRGDFFQSTCFDLAGLLQTSPVHAHCAQYALYLYFVSLSKIKPVHAVSAPGDGRDQRHRRASTYFQVPHRMALGPGTKTEVATRRDRAQQKVAPTACLGYKRCRCRIVEL